MHWNKHLRLQGEHAFLSPSSYHWVNYTPNRLLERWTAVQASAYGNAMHEYVKQEIEAKRKSDMVGTIGLYINDAIHFNMQCEQILYYSDNCFGTTDAIGFRYNTLRIHDLKTGKISGSIHQLEIYAALFCLEYEKDPDDIKIVLSIYQDNKVDVYDADPEDIKFIMEKIIESDKIISIRRLEEES